MTPELIEHLWDLHAAHVVTIDALLALDGGS